MTIIKKETGIYKVFEVDAENKETLIGPVTIFFDKKMNCESFKLPVNQAKRQYVKRSLVDDTLVTSQSFVLTHKNERQSYNPAPGDQVRRPKANDFLEEAEKVLNPEDFSQLKKLQAEAQSTE